MEKSLMEQAKQQAQIAKASMEQLNQVKEAVEERTETLNNLQAQQKKTQDTFEKLFNQCESFNKSMATFYNQLAKYDSVIKDTFDKNISTMNDISNSVKRELRENITNELQENINEIKNITNRFNESAKSLSQNLQNDFNVYKSDLQKTIEQAQSTINKKSLGLLSELGIALVISVIAIFIILFYCLNWQFNFIDLTLPQNELIVSVIKSVVLMLVGIALFCIIRAFLGGKRQ